MHALAKIFNHQVGKLLLFGVVLLESLESVGKVICAP